MMKLRSFMIFIPLFIDALFRFILSNENIGSLDINWRSRLKASDKLHPLQVVTKGFGEYFFLK